jgi:fatty acid desaturase
MRDMTWYLCVGGCVILYMILGVATATIAIIADGEPEKDNYGFLLFVVAFWPIVAAILLGIFLPVFLARKIRAWRDAKPEAFGDDVP